MSQNKTESRRSFMKNFGKLAGCTLAAMAGMTLSDNEADAQYAPYVDVQSLKWNLDACNRAIDSCRQMERAAMQRGDVLGAQRWARQRAQYELLKQEILRRLNGGY